MSAASESRAGSRRLIVNADDFGRSAGRNAGVIRAHEQGIVTSASLMVCWPAAAAAAGYGRERTALSLGLHVDLADWEFASGAWRAVYERVDPSDRAAVEAEVGRQLERFRDLAGRDPTHIDAHQHVHREPPARGVLRALSRALALPLRDHSPARYSGGFYGQTGQGEPLPEYVGVENLERIIAELAPGVTELGCHPGLDLGADVYAREAALEVETLCDPRVRATLARERVELISFEELDLRR